MTQAKACGYHTRGYHAWAATITQVPRILGIFTSIFGPAPEQAAA